MREKQQRRKGSDLPPPASSQIHPRAPSSNSAENSLKRRTQIGEVDTDGSAAFGWSVFKHLSSIFNPFFVWKNSMLSLSKLLFFYFLEKSTSKHQFIHCHAIVDFVFDAIFEIEFSLVHCHATLNRIRQKNNISKHRNLTLTLENRFWVNIRNYMWNRILEMDCHENVN